jgi:hypothetical protein
MHKHLKQPLVPADHVNTSLSAGVGEIIDIAMAKDRDERYHSMEEMLEDLELVRQGQPPKHARRNINLEELVKIEETGKTVDITPQAQQQTDIWSQPTIIGLLVGIGISVLLNGILLVLLLVKG